MQIKSRSMVDESIPPRDIVRLSEEIRLRVVLILIQYTNSAAYARPPLTATLLAKPAAERYDYRLPSDVLLRIVHISSSSCSCQYIAPRHLSSRLSLSSFEADIQRDLSHLEPRIARPPRTRRDTFDLTHNGTERCSGRSKRAIQEEGWKANSFATHL